MKNDLFPNQIVIVIQQACIQLVYMYSKKGHNSLIYVCMNGFLECLSIVAIEPSI